MRQSSRNSPACRPDLPIARWLSGAIEPENARSVMGEFVSGNYFRTFGLKPRAGRLLADADDVQGAPFVAVMSYEKWKNDYAGDHSDDRQHILRKHQASHHRRRRP